LCQSGGAELQKKKIGVNLKLSNNLVTMIESAGDEKAVCGCFWSKQDLKPYELQDNFHGTRTFSISW